MNVIMSECLSETKRIVKKIVNIKKINRGLSLVSIFALIVQTTIAGGIVGSFAFAAKPAFAVSVDSSQSKCTWWELKKIGTSWQWVQNTNYNVTKEWCDGKSIPPGRLSEYTPTATAKISGYKYEDIDNNGIGEGDVKLAGWEIVLSGNKSASTTTNADGYYIFSGLMPGNYTVSEGSNAGKGTFVQSVPAGSGYSIALFEAENNTGNNFANYFPTCGNSMTDVFDVYSESCDDGILNGVYGYCNSDCSGQTASICGNGVKEGDEKCDGSDGVGAHQSCSDQCLITDLPYCGDSVKNGNEACDGSDGVGEHQACAESCTIVDLAFCGDNIKNGNEQCDGSDGTVEHYSCTSSCTLEYIPYCGDQIKNNNEDCDSNDGIGKHQSCSETCSIIDLPYCGDGIANGSDECDDGNTTDSDGCSSTCQVEPNKSTIWGYKYYDKNKSNSIEEGDEKLANWIITLEEFNGESYFPKTETSTNVLGYYQFPDLNPGKYRLFESFVGKDDWIATYPNASGYYELDVVASSVYTNNDFANYRKFCGNGIKDENESCDGTDGVSVHYNCTSQCTLNYIPYCGDGIRNGEDECDGENGIGNNQSCSNKCKIENKQDTGTGGGAILFGATGSGGSPVNSFSISEESIKPVNFSDSSITISWLTSHFSSSQIIYSKEGEAHKYDPNDNSGSPPKYGYANATPEYDINPKVTGHSVTITRLESGVKYYYRIISRGSFAISEEHQFILAKTSATENIIDQNEETASNAARENIVCSTYVNEFLRLGRANSKSEALKLEKFLNEFEGEYLAENGVFEKADSDAVSRFQKKYSDDILGPWSANIPTGNVFTTTKNKINEIYCKKVIPLTTLQLNEIGATKARLALGNKDSAQENISVKEGESSISKNDSVNETALSDTAQGDNGIVRGASAENAAIKIEEKSSLESNKSSDTSAKAAGYQSYINYVLILMIFLLAIYAYGYLKNDKKND